jgi:hypothetical protein
MDGRVSGMGSPMVMNGPSGGRPLTGAIGAPLLAGLGIASVAPYAPSHPTPSFHHDNRPPPQLRPGGGGMFAAPIASNIPASHSRPPQQQQALVSAPPQPSGGFAGFGGSFGAASMISPTNRPRPAGPSLVSPSAGIAVPPQFAASPSHAAVAPVSSINSGNGSFPITRPAVAGGAAVTLPSLQRPGANGPSLLSNGPSIPVANVPFLQASASKQRLNATVFQQQPGGPAPPSVPGFGGSFGSGGEVALQAANSKGAKVINNVTTHQLRLIGGTH